MNRNKKVEEKKQYKKPKVRVISLRHKAGLLECSGENCLNADFEDDN